MIALLRQLHIYVGLVASVALVLMGIAGLVATARGGPESTGSRTSSATLALPPGGDATRAGYVARAVHAANVPLGRVPPEWAIRADSAGRLHAEVYTPNGTTQLVLDTVRRVVEVTRAPTSLGDYLVRMHTHTLQWPPSGPLLLIAWGAYMELATVALLFLGASSVLLWFGQDRSSRVGGIALGLGLVTTVALFALVR